MKGPQVKGVTKKNLERLYIDDKDATLDSVSDILGCSRECVRRWLKRFGIPIKPRYRKGVSKIPSTKMLQDRKWLTMELKTKTAKQIGDEIGTASQNVLYWAHKYGIVDGNRSKTIKDAIRKRYPNGRMAEEAANWRGGISIDRGYVYRYCPDHPNAKNGRVQEHRLVMEKHLGRYLEPDEVIHHKDGNKKNNDLSNLELLKRGQHISNHFKASHEVEHLRRDNAELRSEIERLKQIISH
jgi:hypothetical protein